MGDPVVGEALGTRQAAGALEELTRGFRVPGEVIEYAARLLPHIAPGLAPTSVRRSRGELRVVDTGTLLATVTEALAREGSVGLIVPDRLVDATIAQVADPAHVVLGRDVPDEPLETEFDTRLDIVPASLAKGLEFDHVVLLEPEAPRAARPGHRAASALRA